MIDYEEINDLHTLIRIEFIFVTGFAKRGLIHASNFATSMSHNIVCD